MRTGNADPSRAFDEPSLRESIGQYIGSIHRLTGTSHENT